MRKIAITGNSGAGKTTLANRLGALLKIPVTHPDALRYDAGWNLVDEAMFADQQRTAMTADTWIIDGNSLATLAIRAAAADTVMMVDPPPGVCLWGILQRRCRYRGGQHPDDGVFDRITIDSLRYTAWFRRRHGPRTLACIAEHAPHATVVHLTSRRQVNRSVDRLTGQKDQR